MRRFDIRPIPSATCPSESVLPIRLRPDFSVVFEVMREGLSTGPDGVRPGAGLLGPIFSRPVDCAFLVNSLQASGITLFF